MADVCYQNGDDELIEEIPIDNNDVTRQLYADSPPIRKHVFQNGMVSSNEDSNYVQSSSLCYDDLMGDIQIYKLWTRKFGKDKRTAEQGWKEFRMDAITRYVSFDRRLISMENTVNANEDDEELLDMKFILQKREDIDDINMEVDEYDVEFEAISKTFEQFSQYLPVGDHRKKVDAMIVNLRKRYFKFLQDLHRRRELLRWVIPRLQKSNFSGNEMKNWLNSIEPRSESLMSNINNNSSILHNEESIKEIVEEIHMKKDVYEEFLEPGKGILGIDHQMKMDELQQDVEETVPRWDSLCEKIENCLNRVIKEKKAIALQNKSEMEKIDSKVQDEIAKCTCYTPFRIVKVGDGKYTFGTSKTVRLLRIHGNSIVVRIGGGWEYLHNFLLKVDPCRAKQHLPGPPNKGVDGIQSPSMSLNNQDAPVNTPLKPIRRSSAFASPRHINRTHDIINETGDHIYTSGKAFDSFNSSQGSIFSRCSPKSRLKCKLSFDASSKSSCEKSNQVYENLDGKPDGKTENKTRRLSLVERQSLYAQKRQHKSIDIDF